MTDLAVRLPVAGWYKDPASADRLRWWTGETWSQHTIERPTKKDEVATSDERPRSRGAHRAIGEPDVVAAAREAAETDAITTGEIATFIAAETGQTPAVAATPVIAEPAGADLVVVDAAQAAADEMIPMHAAAGIPELAAEADAALVAEHSATAEEPIEPAADPAAAAIEPADIEPAVADIEPAEAEPAPQPAPRAASLVPEVMATSSSSPLLEQLAAAPPPTVPGGKPGSDVVVAASGVSFDELMKQLPFAVDPAPADDAASKSKSGRARRAPKPKAKTSRTPEKATDTGTAASNAPVPAATEAAAPRQRGTQTAGVWLLALLPIIAALLATVAIVLPLVLPAASDFALLGAGALTLLLGLVFAAADDAALAKRGVEKRVTAVIGVLTPLPYLAFRTLSLLRQKRGGAAPLVVFVLLFGAAAAGWFLAGDRLPELIQLVQDQARTLLGV